jgi:hypothetical protein
MGLETPKKIAGKAQQQFNRPTDQHEDKEYFITRSFTICTLRLILLEEWHQEGGMGDVSSCLHRAMETFLFFFSIFFSS